MEFKKVLKLLIEGFNEENIDYALIGGFAMGVLGIARSTIDLDFLVDEKDVEKICFLMEEIGYKKIYSSRYVSQYYSDIKLFGCVDFLHACKKISKQMLKNAMELYVFNKTLKIRVLKPEDIIGLKIQAVKNNPERYFREMGDIDEIINMFKDEIDFNVVRKYFTIFDMDDEYNRFKRYERKKK